MCHPEDWRWRLPSAKHDSSNAKYVPPWRQRWQPVVSTRGVQSVSTLIWAKYIITHLPRSLWSLSPVIWSVTTSTTHRQSQPLNLWRLAKADRRPREKKKFYHHFSIVKYSYLPRDTFKKICWNACNQEQIDFEVPRLLQALMCV